MHYAIQEGYLEENWKMVYGLTIDLYSLHELLNDIEKCLICTEVPNAFLRIITKHPVCERKMKSANIETILEAWCL